MISIGWGKLSYSGILIILGCSVADGRFGGKVSKEMISGLGTTRKVPKPPRFWMD